LQIGIRQYKQSISPHKMSQTAGFSGVEHSQETKGSGEVSQQALPARKPLKFTTTSKQFVLEDENKMKDNKPPQLLEQLRGDPQKPQLPNAHSLFIMPPNVIPQQMPFGGHPYMSMMYPGAQPVFMSHVPIMGPMGHVGMMPGSIVLGPPIPVASAHQVNTQPAVSGVNGPRVSASPFIPAQMPPPFVPQSQQQEADPEEDEELTLQQMMEALIEQGELNVTPSIYNQIVPGEEAPEEMKMNPDLAAFVSTLKEEDYENFMTAYLEACAVKQEHSFGDGSSERHTYSGIADYKSESSDNEDQPDPTGAGNPVQWQDDPEAQARRAEIKKNFFKPDCKDCECCKGYAMSCSGAICKSLNICHCVYRQQCEEAGDELDKVFIQERKDCSCCSGLVYKCPCVANLKKDNCHCIG
jgi:hypothetical protein